MQRRFVCGVVLAMMLVPQLAQAQELSSYSCEQLWIERNAIYKDRGYCFRTARAIRMFGNAGCQFDQVEDVPLSRAERRTINDIQAWERRRGCPR